MIHCYSLTIPLVADILRMYNITRYSTFSLSADAVVRGVFMIIRLWHLKGTVKYLISNG